METSVKELVESGRRYFESRHYSRAELCFLKAIDRGAVYADLLNMLGVICHSQGKFNEAIGYFEKALEINPDYQEANLNLAVLYSDLGEYRKAKPLYKKVHQRSKNSRTINPVMRGKIANLHAGLADTYSGVGLFPEAIDEYKKALKLCPTYKDIRTKLGICYRENNQKELAIKELSQTVRDFPHYNPARLQLGLSYYAQGATPKAVREWREVLKRDKNNDRARMYLRISENHRKK